MERVLLPECEKKGVELKEENMEMLAVEAFDKELTSDCS